MAVTQVKAPPAGAALTGDRQQVTLSITKDGLQLWQGGQQIYTSGRWALVGIALRCLIAHQEGE